MKQTLMLASMPNPFPGMNPYLEQPDFWSDFHNQLVAALARSLVGALLPKYRVVMDEWIYQVSDVSTIAVGRPDVAIQRNCTQQTAISNGGHSSQATIQPVQVTIPVLQEVQQAYLEVRDAATQAVVTTVEILFPANKRGEGRRKYENKRQQVFQSLTNLVEIDLLQDGEALPMAGQENSSHYRILISRGATRPVADLFVFNLGDRIPAFLLPLQSGDSEPLVDLQQLVNDLYDQLGYDYFIDYQNSPPAPWSEVEVAEIIQQS